MLKRRDLFVGAGSAAAALSALRPQCLSAEPNSSPAPLGNVLDPSYVDPRLDSRSVSFENPTGARGSGGMTGGGRKGRPFRILEPGEKIILADLIGPGTVRHFWATFSEVAPELSRALLLEVFYDGLSEPSICVPFLDFFGLPHGRLAEYYSALMSINNGRGLNCHIPMPFRRSMRAELTNQSNKHVWLFYQIDYTLEPSLGESTYLHVSFRRENPTKMLRDFIITEGLKGPGRFLGCSVGIRVIDEGPWYGEGEVKMYRDGDLNLPTYCSTGLEDYIGGAWGMERYYGPYSGVTINVPAPGEQADSHPTLIGFYRWHLADPVMFSEDLRVTIQQIGGAKVFKTGQEAEYAAYQAKHVAAGPGWLPKAKFPPDSLGFGIVERSDDYCAAAFVFCRKPQGVPRFDTKLAVRDIDRLPEEQLSSFATQNEEWEKFTVEVSKHWGGPPPQGGTDSKP